MNFSTKQGFTTTTPSSFFRSLVLLFVVTSSCIAFGKDWHVGPGQAYTTPMAINWAQVSPGDNVLIHPGVYTGSLVIENLSGTSSQPITIKAFDNSQMPVFSQGLALRNSHWIELSNLEVTMQGWTETPSPYLAYPAVIFENNSSDIFFANSYIHDAFAGIAAQNAGYNINIRNNRVVNNAYHGITLRKADGNPDSLSQVYGNIIEKNGQHGIELQSSYYRIERNQVSDNGAETRVLSPAGGTSAIHLVGNGSDVNCNYNTVIYNTTSGQKDRIAADGNGIEIDHFCSNNQVLYNLSWNNDGAGIIIFTASSNVVRNNTIYGNQRDTNRVSRNPNATIGEFLLTVTDSVNNINTTGANNNNVVLNNLIVSDQGSVPAMNVESRVTTAVNTVGPNMLYSTAGAAALNWGGIKKYTSSDVDTRTGTTGNLVEAPHFVDIGGPLSGGYRLKQRPSSTGNSVVVQSDLDFAGFAPYPGESYFGAYFTYAYDLPACSASPNPANSIDTVTITCLNVQPGATILVPGATCVPTPATTTVTCTGLGGDLGNNPTLTIRDPAGSTRSTTLTLTLLDAAPAAPVIDSLSPMISPVTISGSALANATVTITEEGTVLCTTVADASGKWRCTLELLRSSEPGEHTVLVSQTALETGLTSIAAQTVVNVLSTLFTGSTATGTGIAVATISGGGAGCGFDTLNTQFVAATSGAPKNLQFPHGMIRYMLRGCDVGSTVSVNVTWPSDISTMQYWQYGYANKNSTTQTWFQPSAVLTGSVSSITVTDGGDGDQDQMANGTVVDPSGPAQVEPISPPPSVLDVPFLANDAKWILVLLILLAGFATRQTSPTEREVK